MSSPIKLRCTSWPQVASIYKRDLVRGALFLKTQKTPPLGAPVRIELSLPSGSVICLSGAIHEHVGAGGMDGRGPGVDVKLISIPQSAMWMIESALAAQREASTAAPMPARAPTAGPPAGPAGPARAGPANQAPAGQAPAGQAPARPPPPVEDDTALSEAEEELLTALSAELASIQRLNPFQVLGLGYHPSDDDVRRAFAELTQRYHPDRYARFSSTDLRQMAAEIFILIRDAYGRVATAELRAGARPASARSVSNMSPVPSFSTVATSLPSRPPKRPTSAMPPTRAQTAASRSTVGMLPAPPQREASGSQAAPPPASPREATGPIAGAGPGAGEMARIEDCLDAARFDEAVGLCQELLQKSPRDTRAKATLELIEGLRAMRTGDRMEAAQRFETTLELDPSNERAARELAEMRRKATLERKGMLSRLLKGDP